MRVYAVLLYLVGGFFISLLFEPEIFLGDFKFVLCATL